MEERRIDFIILFSIVFLFLIISQSFIFALNLSTSAVFHIGDSLFSIYNNDAFNDSRDFRFAVILLHSSDTFHFFGSIGAKNDGVFNDPFSNRYYAGFYFLINEGGIKLEKGPLKLILGKLHQVDVIDSPYSLFISSFPVARNQFSLTYDDGSFFYTTRWVELCNLKNGLNVYENLRSANYKVYALKFGKARFGYQDVAIYVGKNFDFEYFANPVPSFFVQYVNFAGRPYPEGLGETNFIMGFFFDYSDDMSYLYTQVLIDDFNANRVLHPDSYQNPDKIAWSMGLKYTGGFGELGLYHAGATKYTFQPSAESDNQRYYGYTYYPDFVYSKDSTDVILPLEMLYAGYKYGENNMAFEVNYKPSILPELKCSLEFVVLGERSPVNPWNERTSFLPGTHFLEDPVKEFRMISTFEYTKTIMHGLKINTRVSAGYIWNGSVLVPVDTDVVKKPVLRPLEGNNFPFLSLDLSATFSMSF